MCANKYVKNKSVDFIHFFKRIMSHISIQHFLYILAFTTYGIGDALSGEKSHPKVGCIRIDNVYVALRSLVWKDMIKISFQRYFLIMKF